MTTQQLSSGDLLADRRADYARMFAESGAFAEAAEVMEQALELAPDWAAGWFRFADYAEKSGRKEAATAALERVVTLDPEDIFGAVLKLALFGATEVPPAPPSRYVEQLFDDYAERFDEALVERLDYSVPESLTDLILQHVGNERRFAHVIDLGCGTGLFGERIRDRADFLQGFDLSANMLAKAADKQTYDRLAQADLSLPFAQSGVPSALSGAVPDRQADLVSAADVLMYLGDLAEVFDTAARLLEPGGLFAFSVEDARTVSAQAVGEGFVLRRSLRYAHSESFIRERADGAGFAIVAMRREVIRTEAGNPVHGLLFVARRT